MKKITIPLPSRERLGEGGQKKLALIARQLRNNSTDVEQLLWSQIRNRQIAGLKFRRQQRIDFYVVDFICYEKKVIVELDGGQHAISHEKDLSRDKYLKSQGFRILRFWNNEVLQNVEGVKGAIWQALT